jgi:hypothetical protein
MRVTALAAFFDKLRLLPELGEGCDVPVETESVSYSAMMG